MNGDETQRLFVATLTQGNIIIEGPQGVPGLPGDVGAQGPEGPQGIQGDAGAQGIQGVQGDVGPQGDPGPQGDQGIQGIPGTPGIQGLQGDAGPQGDPGPQGDAGAQGPQGDTGPAGTIDENDLIFGQGRAYDRDDTERCTTLKQSWVTQLTMTTPVLIAGTYRLGWRFRHSQSVASKSMDMRMLVDGSPVETSTHSTNDNDQDVFRVVSNFFHLPGITDGAKTIDLQFKNTDIPGNFETCMKDARMEWWRVA